MSRLSPPASMDLWILAGQSNMQGRGLIGDPRFRPQPDDAVWSFSMAQEWEPAVEPLHRLWESVTPAHGLLMRPGLPEADRGMTDEQLATRLREQPIHGPELGVPFGRAVAAATGAAVGLIPTAHGGTSLSQWAPTDDETGASLYSSMIVRTRRAVATSGGTLRGVLWYQGESDTMPAAAAVYETALRAWVDAVRADLSQPDLPVHVVQLGRLILPPADENPVGFDEDAWDAIRDIQLRAPQAISRSSVVPAVDLGLADGIHIDAPGLDRLGRRLARVALGHPTPGVRDVIRIADQANGLPVLQVNCDGVDDGWTQASRITGFSTHRRDGRRHETVGVVEARRDVDDPTAIQVVLTGWDDDIALGYGRGYDPACTLTDHADMALPSFLTGV